MAKTIRKTRVVGNPATRNNSILGLAFNPAGKGRSSSKSKGVSSYMAKTKQKASGPKKAKRNSAKKNTSVVKAAPSRVIYMTPKKAKPQKRRNAGSSSLADMVIGAVVTVAAAVASKIGAQAVLGAKNTGPMGYAANAAVGAALYFGASRLTRNTTILNGIASGATVQIVLRAASDYTPLGAFTKDLGMGDYMVQGFVAPQVLKDPHNSADISIPDGWGRGDTVVLNSGGNGGGAAVMAPGGMGGLYGRSSSSLYGG